MHPSAFLGAGVDTCVTMSV